ncbi:hypothetical protein L0N00_16860, partial [Eggerthella lenta]|nr:hypothetical protein [Eggerthella lenta]
AAACLRQPAKETPDSGDSWRTWQERRDTSSQDNSTAAQYSGGNEQMHFVKAKGILSAKNGMNIYRGCSHGCIYCDSRSAC